MFKRLIGRHLETSSLFSFPGFVIGSSLALFHLSGKNSLFRHPLYMAVIKLGKISKAHLCITPVIPSFPGAFLFPMLSTAFLIPCMVKSVISCVRGILSLCSDQFMVVSISFFIFRCKVIHVCFRVSRISAVSIPLGFRNVVFLCYFSSCMLLAYIPRSMD